MVMMRPDREPDPDRLRRRARRAEAIELPDAVLAEILAALFDLDDGIDFAWTNPEDGRAADRAAFRLALEVGLWLLGDPCGRDPSPPNVDASSSPTEWTIQPTFQRGHAPVPPGRKRPVTNLRLHRLDERDLDPGLDPVIYRFADRRTDAAGPGGFQPSFRTPRHDTRSPIGPDIPDTPERLIDAFDRLSWRLDALRAEWERDGGLDPDDDGPPAAA